MACIGDITPAVNTRGILMNVSDVWAACVRTRAPGPTSAPDSKPLTAILLIARDGLPDPNFAGSVVLVMNNLGPAPVGIIVNRPMPTPVSRLFPDLKRLAQVHDRLYFGGPIEFG